MNEATNVTASVTETVNDIPAKDSSLFGVSMRAWLAVMLVGTVCVNQATIVTFVMIEAAMSHDFAKVGTFTTVGEPLYSLSIAAAAFYLGQKVNKP